MPFNNKEKQREYQREYQRKRRAEQRKYEEDEYGEAGIAPAIKSAVLVTAFFALSALGFLAFFDLAGVFGVYFKLGLTLAFGWGALAFPILLFVIGVIFLKKINYSFNKWEVVSVVLLFLALVGIFHHAPDFANSLQVAKSGAGGGWVGYILVSPLTDFIGYWGVWVFLASLLVVGGLISFNIYLSISREDEEYEEDEEDEESEEEELEEEPTWVENILSKLNFWRYKKQYSGEDDEQEPEEDEGTEENDEEEGAEGEMELGEDFDEEEAPKLPKKIRRKVSIPIDLLEAGKEKPSANDLNITKENIQKTLANFGINVDMGDVSVGPTITQYTLKPAEGIKLSRITGLANDLSLSLAAHPLRIEAPIPGKSLIGIEVPNQATAVVKLKDILVSSEFKKRSSNLSVALGKDVSGKPWVVDLAKMPHLLIAGSTGSGKSVAINSLIISLLYQNSPDDLKFVMVDPKKVELNTYNDIPYLLTPVITEVKKTVSALKWVVSEMERRYQLLSSRGKRNIESYNQSNKKDSLPYIVFVIDELADLMAVAANEVEAAIVRLAQMARAVGIHLVLATQRPSVNVITGLIKANVPSRMAFSVPSQVDSRTILDTAGAEKLLGRGDMLFISSDLGKPRRIQGTYLGDDEIDRVVSFLKDQGGEAEYQDEVVEQFNTAASSRGGFGDGANDEDELYNDAKEEVIKAGKASASLLQRRLRVGYARAARLLDLLESEGIIGPAEGAKPRDILVQDTDSEAEEFDETNDNELQDYNNSENQDNKYT